MNARRLLKLADFLENLPPKKFDYSIVTHGKEMPTKKLDCGTSACAAGWCPIAFPDHFMYVKPEEVGDHVQVWAHEKGRPIGNRIAVSLFQNPELEDFFGLTRSQALGIFWPNHQGGIAEADLPRNATPKQVASLIRRFVKKNSKTRK